VGFVVMNLVGQFIGHHRRAAAVEVVPPLPEGVNDPEEFSVECLVVRLRLIHLAGEKTRRDDSPNPPPDFDL
jgi:hypothetical protein